MKNLNLHINTGYLILALFYGWTCHSQEKRMLTPEDYNLWHTLNMGEVSEDGVWTSFSKLYDNNIDTLFLKNTVTDFQYVFPSGNNEKITPKGDLFAYLKSGTLHILQTTTGEQKEHPNVVKFEFTKDGKHLIYQSNSTTFNTLVIINIKTGQVREFENIKEYSLSPTEKYLAMIQTHDRAESVKLINLLEFKLHKLLSQNHNSEYQNLTWNTTGNSLAYYISSTAKNDYKIVFTPNVDNPSSIIKLDPTTIKNFPTDVYIIKTKLHISNNGDKVFFDTTPVTNISEIATKIQVWKSSDKEIPPKSKINFQKWNVWLPIENKVYEIERDNLIVSGITDNYQKAILLDNDVYLPLYEYGDRYSDVYVMDLNTGIKKKIIQKQLRAYHHIVIDPKEHYIAYFKNKHWWIYDIKTDKETCVTKNIQAVFNKSMSDRLDDHRAYGFGGWTSSGQMMVYDEFDIWLISTDGRKSQKMTSGGNSGIRYRINTYLGRSIRDSFFGFVSTSYDLNDELLMRNFNTNKLSEGFGVWDKKKGFQEIIHKDWKITHIKIIGENNFQISISRFDMPSKILSINTHIKQIAQANEQQKQFYWGKSKLIYYQSPDGKKLKGALFYPANYDSSKTYPMIVSIYENMSNSLHEYIIPSLKDFGGFNVTNYSSDGYFVLLPDIAYTLNKPGNSALECVSSAIDEAVKIGSIDENNIGLIGHSFGGFETTYIISQTDRFKTAVAGAGVTDLLSFYLDIDSSNLSNIERFESEQFRNKIPFTDTEFLMESPIMNVKTMNTPILLFFGSNDRMVKPSYNIKLFLALWRLKKDSILVIYPDEEHSIVNEIHQIDLTLKIKKWFNSFLKNKNH
ncbi:MAG TPA: prolyl oligopeptidase family serine peptidase [Gelidibacter sp.]|nr:prolyl oligopeptidase family serine peptidase [Gelidibacter sp.]